MPNPSNTLPNDEVLEAINAENPNIIGEAEPTVLLVMDLLDQANMTVREQDNIEARLREALGL
jgi:predicted component of type VI protein secretion system